MINNNKQTEGKKMENTLSDFILAIQCFQDSNKYFWIDKLNTCDSNKGFLLSYFNLI